MSDIGELESFFCTAVPRGGPRPASAQVEYDRLLFLEQAWTSLCTLKGHLEQRSPSLLRDTVFRDQVMEWVDEMVASWCSSFPEGCLPSPLCTSPRWSHGWQWWGTACFGRYVCSLWEEDAAASASPEVLSRELYALCVSPPTSRSLNPFLGSIARWESAAGELLGSLAVSLDGPLTSEWVADVCAVLGHFQWITWIRRQWTVYRCPAGAPLAGERHLTSLGEACADALLLGSCTRAWLRAAGSHLYDAFLRPGDLPLSFQRHGRTPLPSYDRLQRVRPNNVLDGLSVLAKPDKTLLSEYLWSGFQGTQHPSGDPVLNMALFHCVETAFQRVEGIRWWDTCLWTHSRLVSDSVASLEHMDVPVCCDVGWGTWWVYHQGEWWVPPVNHAFWVMLLWCWRLQTVHQGHWVGTHRLKGPWMHLAAAVFMNVTALGDVHPETVDAFVS